MILFTHRGIRCLGTRMYTHDFSEEESFVTSCLPPLVRKPFNPLLPGVLLKGRTNNTDPNQTPHNVASDQGVHCLVTGVSIKNIIKATK